MTAQGRCNAWNLANRVGTLVRVERVCGEPDIRRTRTEAHVKHGQPVIGVQRITGLYHLDQVRPLHELTLEYR
jgi:hypothetical protein